MNAHGEWNNVLRMVWMNGGLVAVNGPGQPSPPFAVFKGWVFQGLNLSDSILLRARVDCGGHAG